MLFVLVVLEMSVQIPAEAAGADQHDGQVKFVPDVAECFHVVAELDAHPGEEVAPDQRTYKSEDEKLEQWRFKHASWEGNKGSDNRQHAADEESDVTVFGHPLVS